ncbi:Alpha-E domain-containing protein [Azospirillaceae bacterium]
MSHLLARYAESIFWMARYMERAENLARILEVHETFSHDGGGAKDWRPILQLNADERRFFERFKVASAENVIRFYVLDAENPTSILAGVRAARENARILRPWISTEMWSHINIFYNQLLALTPQDMAPHALTRHCAVIKEACQAHTGITEGTFYRDQSWFFYQLGKHIERADQTTRLLDIEYHKLLPSLHNAASLLDFVQWHAVLRSAAGYHAFRRVYPRGMTSASVAGFMLFNEAFPRSVMNCMRQIAGLLMRVRSQYQLRGGNDSMEVVDLILAALEARPIDQIIQEGLHDYLDWLQLRLCDVTSGISRDFFGGAPVVNDA